MPRRGVKKGGTSPAERLEESIEHALDVVKKAHRHRMKLTGDNYYANKVVELRADATNAFSDLSGQSAGDTSAMAELIETVFSPEGQRDARAKASRELLFSLKTTWRDAPAAVARTDEGLFPLGILTQAKRGYLITIGRQMNGCFTAGWYDASAVMMRRLIEIAIIEAFEKKGIATKIKDGDGNYAQLTELIARAIAEPSWSLSRNARKFLPQMRDIGHSSAHGRYFLARKGDIERLRQGCRLIVEEFLHHAGLL